MSTEDREHKLQTIANTVEEWIELADRTGKDVMIKPDIDVMREWVKVLRND